MQEVAAGVGNVNVNAVDFGLGLFPVVAEFLLASHYSLIALQFDMMFLEGVERLDNQPVADRGKSGYADVNTYC